MLLLFSIDNEATVEIEERGECDIACIGYDEVLCRDIVDCNGDGDVHVEFGGGDGGGAGEAVLVESCA